MKKCLFFLLIITLGCKNKKEEREDDTPFFPVLSYLQSQVAHIDTSLYRIIKIETVDKRSDTTYLKREDFRTNAKDFLSLPDLSQKKWRKRYKETRMYDEELERVILNYTPDNENEEIRRQEVLIRPGGTTGDEVKTIFIDLLKEANNSSVQKRMTWNVDKNFEIINIIQKKNGAERVESIKVIWNNFAPVE
jgi:HD superfamily phosphohydrolase